MKRTLLASLASLAALVATAQKGPHIGAHALFNSVWIIHQESYGAEEYDYTLKTAPGFGLVAGYNFTTHLGLQAQLDFIKAGQNYKSSKGTGFVRKYDLSYTAVPILLKYTSGEGMVRFYGQIGPQFEFLSKATITAADSTGANSITIDAKNRFSSSDVGVNFGLGANIYIVPALYINAGLAFYYGFNDINTAAFRIPRPSNHQYTASHNGLGGVDVGLHYILLR